MPLNPHNPKGELVRDPHLHKNRYERWKQRKDLVVHINGQAREITGPNRDIILRYLQDLEYGVNMLPGRRGQRGNAHLNTTRTRLSRLAWMLAENTRKNLAELTRKDVVPFFHAMRNGTTISHKGQRYKSTCDYVKCFKAFWHWHTRVQREAGRELSDVTIDLDSTRDVKPPFVYFTIDELKQLCADANRKMRTMMWFMFDSGIRSPTELSNVKGKDILGHPNGVVELHIREETSKTFGRRIKLMLCGQLLLDWIKDKSIGPDDFLFSFHPVVVNRYLKRLGARVFPNGTGKGRTTLGRERFDQLTMYDFRHASCCYWLPRYKSESALKYRFGWKKSDMIHYYSELLGMRDTIAEQDLLEPEARVQLERDLEHERQERTLLQDQLRALHDELQELKNASMQRARADDIMSALLADPNVQEVVKKKLAERGLVATVEALADAS